MSESQKKRVKKILFVLLQIVLVALAGYGLVLKLGMGTYPHIQDVGKLENVQLVNSESFVFNQNGTYDTEWAIYIYMCGSNLESGVPGGAASSDLDELFSVPAPAGVKYVIQTGGAAKWYNNYVDANATDRFVYDENGINRVYRGELSNMGEEKTFTDFLQFCTANYPAKNIGVILWDHGGGPIGGACNDENFEMDSLNLLEMGGAMDTVFERDSNNPPLSFIGFDACLMATIEVAQTYEGYSDYLIASEEVEGGSGWNYVKLAETLAASPQTSAKDLGTAILDGFYTAAVEEQELEFSTLALIDLTKIPALSQALDEFGLDLLTRAQSDPTVLARMKRGAVTAEQYGTDGGQNSIYNYFWNMSDMEDLITNIAAETKTEPDAVLAALDEAVVYSLHGETNENASGISMFFPYDAAVGFLDSQVIGYVKLTETSDPIRYLYEYAVSGYIPDEGIAYLNSAGKEVSDVTSEVLTIGDLELEDWAVFTEGDSAVLELGPDIAANLSDVSLVNLGLQVKADESIELVFLGNGTRIEKDWENGVFNAVFDGMWVSLGNQPLYADCTYEGRTYSLYSSPIMLNGEDYILRFSKDNATGAYKILGAIGVETEGNVADRDLITLKEGDEIVPISRVMSYETFMTLDENADDTVFLSSFERQNGLVIVYTPETVISETMLRDGYYLEVFVMSDAMGREALSAFATREIADGKAGDWETE
jgi:hypothetical protein